MVNLTAAPSLGEKEGGQHAPEDERRASLQVQLLFPFPFPADLQGRERRGGASGSTGTRSSSSRVQDGTRETKGMTGALNRRTWRRVNRKEDRR